MTTRVAQRLVARDSATGLFHRGVRIEEYGPIVPLEGCEIEGILRAPGPEELVDVSKRLLHDCVFRREQA